MIRYLAVALLAALSSAPPAAAQRPKTIEQAGPFTQAGSGAVFPEQVGAFRRGTIYQYDANGHDVSATYNLLAPEGRLAVTVYVYRPAALVAQPAAGKAAAEARAATCSRLFEDARVAILERGELRATRRGEAPPVDRLDAALRKRQSFSGRTRFDGADRDVRSRLDLYCFVTGNWMVKYRATFLAGFDATPQIDAFIVAGPWPRRAIAAGGGSGAPAARGPAAPLP